MKYELSNNKQNVYQWDQSITLTITEPENVPEVHFKWGDQAVPIAVTDQQVAIPPELMQLPQDIVLWAYTPDHTMDMAKIKLQQRPKPSDYAYTPTEVKTWEQLDERIKVLEDGGVQGAVKSVNGQTGDVTITAEGLGALTEDDLQEATDKALAQAKASGEFDGAQGSKGDTGAQGPQGETGPQGPAGPAGAGLDVTGATVGQTVKISAVDSNGVPTAWEPVDMASGGETPWELLATISITENIVTLTSTLPKACTEVTLYFHGIKTASNAQLMVNRAGSANNFVTTSAKYIEVQLKMLTGQDRIRRTDIDHSTYGFWQGGNCTSRLTDSTISGITEISIYTSNPVGVEFTAGTIYVYGR